MEAIIARLVEQFEQGRISRRGLVRSLATAAMGGALVGAKSPGTSVSRASAALPKTAWWDHVAYSVADYGRSRDFYAGVLGWEILADDPERGEARLRIGEGLGDMIIRNGDAPDGGPTGVVGHLCWGLDTYDTDAVREDLEARGLNPRRDQGGQYGAFDSYHVLDPDGWDVQLAVRLR